MLTDHQQAAIDDYVTQCCTHWHAGAIRTLVTLQRDPDTRVGPKALQWAVEDALQRYAADPSPMIVAWLERDAQTLFVKDSWWATT